MAPVLRTPAAAPREPAASGWDAFVESVPGGAYQQSPRWAEVKASVGWSASHIVVREADRVAGGCQILHRSVRGLGAIAYVSRGPVLAAADATLAGAILDRLDAWARAHAVRYLKLQPGPVPDTVLPALGRRGFVPSSVAVAPVATVRIDLARTEEELFAALSRTRRKNLRRARRSGVVAEHGGMAELSRFHELVAATAARHGFTPYPVAYYAQILRSFAGEEQSALLLVRRDGTAVAGQLLLGFGDTAYTKVFGRAGTDAGSYASEVLDWASIRWAKERGFRFLDLDGIALPLAEALAAGRPVPFEPTPSHYKLQYGGDVVLGPRTYDAVRPRAFTPALRLAAPRLDRLAPLAQRTLKAGRRAGPRR